MPAIGPDSVFIKIAPMSDLDHDDGEAIGERHAEILGREIVPLAACPPVRTLWDRRAANTGGQAASGATLNPWRDDAFDTFL